MMDLLGWTVMAIVALPLFCALVVMAGYKFFLWLGRERGPWVVTRVNASVNGGVEFYADWKTPKPVWSVKPSDAKTYPTLEKANDAGYQLLADVAPLSKYMGVK